MPQSVLRAKKDKLLSDNERYVGSGVRPTQRAATAKLSNIAFSHYYAGCGARRENVKRVVVPHIILYQVVSTSSLVLGTNNSNATTGYTAVVQQFP